jgi:hypothetical protein
MPTRTISIHVRLGRVTRDMSFLSVRLDLFRNVYVIDGLADARPGTFYYEWSMPRGTA